MNERLPKGQFDRLAKGIWGLGQKSMSHMIEIAPLPALVKGELYHGELCLEPEFDIKHPFPIALEKLPEHVGLTISEFEKYVKDPQYTLYSLRRLVLNTRARTKTFEKGIVLMNSNGHSITPHIDKPALGSRTRRGTQQWRELREKSSFDTFDQLEAEFFLSTIEEASIAIDKD